MNSKRADAEQKIGKLKNQIKLVENTIDNIRKSGQYSFSEYEG